MCQRDFQVCCSVVRSVGGEDGSSGGEGHLEDNVQLALGKEGDKLDRTPSPRVQDTFFSVCTKQPARQ